MLFGWAMRHYPAHEQKEADRVMECFELCARHGNVIAALNLGTFYYNGLFVEEDYKKAFELYKIAADAGIDRALCNCGYCYYYGKLGKPDYEKAYLYFSKGALLYRDSNCLYKLGDMFLNGYYVKKNEEQAVILYEAAFRKCAEHGDDEFCIGDILERLGKCHLKGIGVPQNVLSGHRYLSLASTEFYKRCGSDTKAGALIAENKKLLKEAERILNKNMV